MNYRKVIGWVIVIIVLIIFLAVDGNNRVSAGYFDSLEDQKSKMHMLAEYARSVGCSEDSSDIREAKRLWQEAQDQIDYEIDMLARVVYFEAGSNHLTDRHQQLVACVLLNRCLYDERFPNTIKENIYRKGQYSCAPILYKVDKDMIPQRCYDNARAAAYGLVECPTTVIFQSQAKQGTSIYEYHYNTYFCHG